MLPYSLHDGWNVVSDGKTVPFEAALDGKHVVAHLEANGDEVTILVGGSVLVIRLDVFKQLTARALVAAHSRPGADRG